MVCRAKWPGFVWGRHARARGNRSRGSDGAPRPGISREHVAGEVRNQGRKPCSDSQWGARMSVRGIWPATGPRLSQSWLRGMLVGYAAGVGFCASIAVILAAYTWCTHGPKARRQTAGNRSPRKPHRLMTWPHPLSKRRSRPGKPAVCRVQRPLSKKYRSLELALRSRRRSTLRGGIRKLATRRRSRSQSGRPPCRSRASDWFLAAPISLLFRRARSQQPHHSCSRRSRGLRWPTSRWRNQNRAVAHAKVCSANRSLDTALTWAKSPAEAAGEASREGKLVFLIHVSGNFEDPGFT